MTFRSIFTLSFLALFQASGVVNAQTPSNWEANANIVVAFPQAEFSRNVNNVGIGGIVGVGYSPAGSPFMVGLEGGFMTYGQERRQEPFSTTIPDVTVNVETSNNIALGHFVARVQVPSGPIRPFAEGVAGFKYLFTTTQIENRATQEPIAASTNFDDWAWSYGGGVGLQIQVWERGPAREDQPQQSVSRVFLEAKGRYLLGTEAEYLKRGSIRRENGQVAFDVQRSRTDMLLVQIGVAVQF